MKERRKYIFLNAGVWLAALVAGVFALVLLREVGLRLTVQHKARVLLSEARDQLRAGNLNDAQRSAITAIAAAPEVAADAVAIAGGELLGMPALDERVRQAFETEPPSEIVLARYELAAGNAARALELLRDYHGSAPEPYLWLGRLNADQGDFEAAAKAYETYWKLAGTSRSEGDWGVKGVEPGQPLDQAWKLFKMGLWRKAIEAVPADSEKPERLFYQGLSRDLGGDRAGAMEFYAELLKQRPSHLAALKRLEFLARDAR